ncbi:MAG TPA: HAMP domain-containing sensor histidine kinase [Vicinamibacterales bacterium]|nr:HAMP domain-containing sensor histidine kinase [Vicinamibacterales bacterium]
MRSSRPLGSRTIYAYGSLLIGLLPILLSAAFVIFIFNSRSLNQLPEGPVNELMCSQIGDLRAVVVQQLGEGARSLNRERAEGAIRLSDRYPFSGPTRWTVDVGYFRDTSMGSFDSPQYREARSSLINRPEGARRVDRITVQNAPYRQCMAVFDLQTPELKRYGRAVYAVAWPEGRYLVLRDRFRLSLRDATIRLSVFVGGLVLLIAFAILLLQNVLVGDSLRRLQRDIQALVDGKASRLGSDHPRELMPVVGLFNAAITANEQDHLETRNLITKIAHDLNNKLQFLVTSVKQEPINRRNVTRVISDISAMIDRYRELSRTEGSETWRRLRFDVAKVLLELVQVQTTDWQNQKKRYVLRVRGEEVDIRDIDAEPPSLEVIGKEADVEIIASNLFTNASKYGGDRVEVSLEEDGADVMIHVDDNGPGIPDEKLDLIFADGVRLRVDQDRPGSGMGLGIVRAIAANMGGSVSASRSPLGGARFTLRLPILARRQAGASSVLDATTSTPGQN